MRLAFLSWITIGLLVLFSVGLNAYLLRTEAAGDALSNGKEAYFFIFRTQLGRHVRWIGYPLIAAGEMFGRIEPPDDARGTMYVIQVTSSHVERHVQELTDRIGPGMLTPIDGRIWANFPTLGGLCWWAGDHFEPATQDELRRLDGISHLDNNYYRERNGWSKETVWPGQTAVINLGDGTELSAYNPKRSGPLLIEMRKQGREPINVFSVDTGSGLVSRSEYQDAFHGSK